RVDNLFKTCIQQPTLAIKEKMPWVASVLWDNAGAAYLNEDYLYTITGETHNSPSNMEAYGGAITGIVGVYRDPMGTGKGSRIIAGMYGYCVGPRDYKGPLRPHLHPKRLLDGVIEGVRDGGNKSGIPTPFGNLFFHESYLGKCLVFVSAIGIMPSRIKREAAHTKATKEGDLIIMVGGKVGKDGIHGVTAASDSYSEHTPAGHVQIGDPYTQKKMQDFLLEVRDEGLIEFITDNGGGGLSSSIGESARFSNGCYVELDKVPLKYEGLDQWEIWVSESQERMTVAIKPKNRERFFQLSRKHDVESTVIGRFTSSGKLHLLYEGKTCAYIDMDLLEKEFPQWEFQAEWIPPELRGLKEPVLGEPTEHGDILLSMMYRPNICSREWVVRQYDHEVQGTSIIKPLVGRERDVHSDAIVLRPVLKLNRGLALTQAINPTYSRIDAYHMTMVTMDEAARRILSVGGTLDHIGAVDNFCWPNIQHHPENNPDGKLKAAQLVRANWALKESCQAFSIPLLSGKDSMYIDGTLKGAFGETHKVSGLETLQIAAVGLIEDIERCVSMDAKLSDDRVYIVGLTRNELGGSEYYDLFGHIGLIVPTVSPEDVIPVYRALEKAVSAGLVASLHGVYRGGLGVHLAQVAFAGNLGMEIDLRRIPCKEVNRNDTLLYSESGGRFIATVAPNACDDFEETMKGHPFSNIGVLKDHGRLKVSGLDGKEIIDLSVSKLKKAWKETFGDLV
ncbi:MAG: phosphoribosylformylglycinamidine synthase, partial [Thermoplasmata archaeon]